MATVYIRKNFSTVAKESGILPSYEHVMVEYYNDLPNKVPQFNIKVEKLNSDTYRGRVEEYVITPSGRDYYRTIERFIGSTEDEVTNFCQDFIKRFYDLKETDEFKADDIKEEKE